MRTPMHTMYGKPLSLPEGFVDRSIYIYYLRSEGQDELLRSAPQAPPEVVADDAVALRERIRYGAAASVGPAARNASGRFVSNVLVTRQPSARALLDVVATMRREVLAGEPGTRVIGEGPMTVAGRPAHQVAFASRAGDPSIALVQWHVTTVRDGHACTFYCTAEEGRWDAYRPRFEALVAGWRGDDVAASPPAPGSSESLFSHPIDVPPEFQNESLYVFALEDASRERGAVRGLRPNVTVDRRPTWDALEAVVAAQRKDAATNTPNLKLVQHGPFTVAGLPAHQCEYRAALEDPALTLVQWRVTTVREGYAYTWFCTSEAAHWPHDRRRFEAFIGGWE